MDLISRQAAIDLVRDVCDAILSQCGSHYDGDDEVYDDLLEVDAVLKCNKEIRISLANMPSVQGWIPVGERLPPSGEDVIVSLHDDSGDTSFDYTSVGWTTPKGEYWIVGGDINRYVCAWMPMPRAYKGEE